jgi:3-hydroxyisobutyrate dehydrogenase
MRVAVLGTGTMGIGMVHSLLRNGIDVTAWNRNPDRARPLADDGARLAKTSQEAVADADVVLTILFDEEAVLAVSKDFMGSMKPGAIWMQSSTIGVAGILRVAAVARANNVPFVDAPVVGTKKPAEDGTLAVLVSGEASLIETITPVLDAIGGKTVVAGTEAGAASSLKLACNAWVASLTAATAQSISMCEDLGVDPKLFLHTIDGSASNTPYAQLKGGMMLQGDYTPSFAVDGLAKDLHLMLEALDSDSGELLQTLSKTFDAASESGHGSNDISAVFTTFQR